MPEKKHARDNSNDFSNDTSNDWCDTLNDTCAESEGCQDHFDADNERSTSPVDTSHTVPFPINKRRRTHRYVADARGDCTDCRSADIKSILDHLKKDGASARQLAFVANRFFNLSKEEKHNLSQGLKILPEEMWTLYISYAVNEKHNAMALFEQNKSILDC